MTKAATPSRHSGIVAAVRGVRAAWRQSLQLRVVSTTLLFSVMVVGLLGALLLARVSAGVVDAKERASVTEGEAGHAEAQGILDAADTGATTPSATQLVDAVATSLAGRAGNSGLYEVLLLSTGPRTGAEAPERGTNLVAESSVPNDLRQQVVAERRIAWTYTELRYLDGRVVPGLAVGSTLSVPGVGLYELYQLFPLTQEQATLDLVRRVLGVIALLLIVGLVALAWLVTRQVVTPVRQAAQTADRLSSGHLQERMTVRGEDDLARLARSFNAMAAGLQEQIRRLESLSRFQQRFVSDVSHELRTPLTTIRMAADVLYEDRDTFDAATSRTAELLQTQLDRFEALLTDLLEISRFDAGAVALDVEPIDLRLLCRRAIEAAQPLADKRSTEIVFEEPESPCVAEADPRRVERIVRNLLVNAIEHGQSRPVTISMAASEHAAAIVVRDHGVGLRPGDASLVFNRFWRADPSRARTLGGTGLGLAISLEDAHLHGGWLEAWGVAGDGSQFRLTLPRIAGTELTSSPVPLEPADGSTRVPLPTRTAPRPSFVPAEPSAQDDAAHAGVAEPVGESRA